MVELTGIALALNQDGRLELVSTSADGEKSSDVFHGQTSSDGWSGWSSLSQPDPGILVNFSCGPALARNADWRLEAAIVGGDKAVWHAWQRRPGYDWTGWRTLDQPGGDEVVSTPLGARPPDGTPSLARNADGRLELFVVRRDFTVWHRSQHPGSSWLAWDSLGQPGDGTLGPIAVKADAGGRLALFAHDVDGAVWHRSQASLDEGTDWTRWRSLGMPDDQPALTGPVPARNKDGRLELFVVAGDSKVWHTWQADNGVWQGWHPLGSPGGFLTEVAVGANAEGNLVLFATEQDSGTALWQREQVPGSGWSPWLSRASLLSLDRPVHGPVVDPAVRLNADGQLELFLRVEGTGIMYHLINVGLPSSGSGWSSSLFEL